MRIWALAIGAALAVTCAAPAAAQGAAAIAKSSVGFLGPSESLWTGGLALPACPRPGPRGAVTAVALPGYRTAFQERHGELVAEFTGARSVPPAAVATARGCAARVGDAAHARGLLTEGPAGFAAFQAAFDACMVEADADPRVGSMTLWIDTQCNW